MSFTASQKKFLKAIVDGEHVVFHAKVTKPLFDAGVVFPFHGALFPWIDGCNTQMTSDYFLTDKGIELLSAKA